VLSCSASFMFRRIPSDGGPEMLTGGLSSGEF